MSVLKTLVKFLFGTDLGLIIIAVLIVLVATALLWDVVSAGVNRVLARGRGDDRAEVAEPNAPSESRRSAESRERRASRLAARSAALRAKRDDTPD
ncbi:hypothetical protein [Nocardia sp. NPDC050710]|uniref:hypothetical protein n=1 Tax=Nocardia sp. NPDC050710 TaxID=3157220 RepID=UPI0033EFB9C6